MRLAIISSIVAFATLIAAGPTPTLAARGPTPPFSLWGRPADNRPGALPQRITTYEKSPGKLGLAIAGTSAVSFVWSSDRKVYTAPTREILL